MPQSAGAVLMVQLTRQVVITFGVTLCKNHTPYTRGTSVQNLLDLAVSVSRATRLPVDPTRREIYWKGNLARRSRRTGLEMLLRNKYHLMRKTVTRLTFVISTL